VTTSALSAISLAAQQQVETPYYGLVWLALATIAYTDESSAIVHRVSIDLPASVVGLPDPPAPAGFAQPAAGTWGRWQVDWGPVVSADNANLMYVASYREAASGLPVFTAVAIRGTDTSEKGTLLGLLQEIVEDLDVRHLVPWTDAAGDVASPCVPRATAQDLAIAQGTCEGLKRLRQFTASASMPESVNGVDVLGYVRWHAAAYPGLPIVVTGHSLGACQTTVMAAFLADALAAAGVAATIVPHAFAPPTAGTRRFAAKYDAQFPTGHFWWNTLDIVPNAFEVVPNADDRTPSMTRMHQFWGGYGGPPINDAEKLAIDAFVFDEHAFAQPTTNRHTLVGSVVAPNPQLCANSWLNQLETQHLPPCYHYLIATQMAGVVAPYPLPQLTKVVDPCTQVPPVTALA
jgi:hypothetical protein